MKRLLLLALAGLCLQLSANAQVTLTYPQRSANYYGNFTTGTAGSFDQDSYQLGMYANGGGTKQVVRWRKFRTDASGASGSDRALQVGDVFTVTLSATRANGRIGFALLSAPSSTGSYADRENNYALSINLDGPTYNGGNWGAWYAKYGGGASAGDALVYGQQTSYKNFTFTVTLLAANRANITMSDGTTTSYLFDVLLNSSNPITDYSVFLDDDNDGGGSRNIYWGLGAIGTQHSLANSGAVAIGNSNGTFSINTAIADGLVSNSASTASANTLSKNGTGNITLTAANTYTGTTTINGGTLTLNRTGGATLPSAANVVVSAGSLAISSNQTLNNLTIASGATVSVASGVTVTINGTCNVSNGGSFTGTGNITMGAGSVMKINQGGWPGNTNSFTWNATSTLQFAQSSGSYGVNSGDTYWTNANYPGTVIVPAAGITMNGSRNASNVIANGDITLTGNNITVQNGGTVTLNSGGSASGSGSILFAATGALVYNQGGTVNPGREWTGTLGGTTSVTIQNGTTLNFGASGTNRTVSGALTLGSGSTAGSLNMGSGSGKLTVNGNLLIGGNSVGTSTLTLSSAAGGNLELLGNWNRSAQGVFSNNGRLVSFIGSSQQSLIASGGATYTDLTVNNAAGVLLNSPMTVGGTLTLTAGTLFAGTQTLTINGTVARTAGAIDAGTGTVVFSGGTAQSVPSGTFAVLKNLTVNNSAGVVFNGNTALTGNLALTSGNLSIASNVLAVGGNITRGTGSIDASALHLTFDGSAAQTVAAGALGTNIAHLTVFNAAGVTFDGAQTVISELELASGELAGTITIGNGATIEKANGTLASAPTFAGVVDLIFSTSGTVSTGNELPATDIVRNVLIGGGGTTQLQRSLNINGQLILNSGFLDIGAFNLSIKPDSSSGGNATSYVRTSGTGVYVVKNVPAGGAMFPVGNSTYNPLMIANPVALDWSVRVEDAISNVTPEYGANVAKAVSRQWDITPSQNSPAPGGGATITFVYDGTSDVGGSFNNSANMQLWHYYQGFWAKRGGAVTPGDVDGMKAVTVSGLTYFSPYALSNFDAPLPVTLLSFTGKRNGTVNELKWKTASESNSRGFAVERSSDGVTFAQVTFVPSRANGGNSTSDISYAYSDASAGSAGQGAANKWYYRLKQVDLDGQYKYSAVVLLKGDKSGFITVEGIYPNPVKATASIRIQAGSTGGNIVLQLTDMQGRIVRTKTINTEAGAATTIQMDLGGLAAGQYHLKAIAGEEVSETVTVIKN
ncbi:MAG: T9SS type A sorting domain-containing protein [Chitinophagaceae bacterium]|nr:MAG: T9SS type A sorting domain-containing protein [Chitinophagaceae bacterium]